MKRLAITLGAGLCLALGTALYTRAQDAPPAEPEYRSGSVLALNDWGAFESAMVEALASTGTPDPLVVILPQASTAPDAGAAEVKRFADLGMQSVRLMTELVGDEALNTFDAADVIWFADGDPDLLMKELAAAAVAHRFHQWRVSGKIIGAAGPVSAVLGFTYIHDAHDGHDHSHEHGADGEEEKPLMTHLAVKPVRGLGLWSGFIVPDALVRDRFALTASAVLDQPRLLAMCLGEHGAARIQDEKMFFFGDGPVLVYDARKAKKVFIDENAPHSVRNAKLHCFAIGDEFNWMDLE